LKGKKVTVREPTYKFTEGDWFVMGRGGVVLGGKRLCGGGDNFHTGKTRG